MSNGERYPHHTRILATKSAKKAITIKERAAAPPHVNHIYSEGRHSDIHEKATHDERRCDHLRHHSSAKPRKLRHWHPLLPWQIPKYQVGVNSTHLFSLFSIVSTNSLWPTDTRPSWRLYSRNTQNDLTRPSLILQQNALQMLPDVPRVSLSST